MKFKTGDIIVDKHNPEVARFVVTVVGDRIKISSPKGLAQADFTRQFVEEHFEIADIFFSPLYKLMKEEE